MSFLIKNQKVLAPATRIASIDFWRGLCLLMIFLDHVPDNPLSLITLRSWGFSDAAEVFVFLAGFSAVLSFSRYFVVGGFLCGVLRVVKRTWQLLCAHVLLVFTGAATFALASSFTDSKPIMEQMNFSPFFVETGTAILRLIKLSYMPNLTDILPMYILFIALFPVLWLLLGISPYLALLASAALWLWANITHNSLANYPDGMTWFFNPMAWQFMFVLGASVAWQRDRLGNIFRSKFVLIICFILIAIAFLAVAPWAQIPGISNYRFVSAEFLTDDDKRHLSFMRILHFMALAIVAWRTLPDHSKFWKNGLVKIISQCGRHALPIYCSGVIAAMAIDIYIGTQTTTTMVVSLLEICGVLILGFLAYCLEKGSVILQKANKVPPGRAVMAEGK